MIVRKIFMRALRVGRATALALGVGVMLALVVGLASVAFAANGDPWLLGRSNVATSITSLAGAVGVDGPMLRITNNNAGTNDTALDLRVQAGEAPMKVNSDKMVTNLNADKIDGKEASEFVQGNGRVMDGAAALCPGCSSSVILHNQSPFIDIEYECPSDLTSNGTLVIYAFGTETLNMFSDNGLADPNAYRRLIPGVDDEGNPEPAEYSQPAAANGEHITFQVQGAGMATIEVFSVHRSGDCHVQAQGLFTY
jgi:hypothetical protein